MPSGHDAINAAIRAARGEPLNLTDPAAINRAIRRASGRFAPAADPVAEVGPPPLPGESEDALNVWADQVAEAGMDRQALARYLGHWMTLHRQVLADREADQ